MTLTQDEYDRRRRERFYHRHKGTRDVVMTSFVGQRYKNYPYCAYDLGCDDEHILEAKAMLGTLTPEEEREWEYHKRKRAGIITEKEEKDALNGE